jgi:hypothetical protein
MTTGFLTTFLGGLSQINLRYINHCVVSCFVGLGIPVVDDNGLLFGLDLLVVVLD